MIGLILTSNRTYFFYIWPPCIYSVYLSSAYFIVSKSSDFNPFQYLLLTIEFIVVSKFFLSVSSFPFKSRKFKSYPKMKMLLFKEISMELVLSTSICKPFVVIDIEIHSIFSVAIYFNVFIYMISFLRLYVQHDVQSPFVFAFFSINFF